MKYATYQSYKFSGTDWISDIPGNWECWRLKDCGSLLAGAGFPHEYQGLEDEELPFYKVGDLSQSLDGRHMASGEHTISRKTAYMLRAKVIPPSAIVYAKIGAALLLNRRRITVKNCCIDNNMTAFIPNPRILSTAWAHYWLSTLDFGEFTNPGAVPSLSEGYQATLPIALPPLDEQQTIARFLDAKTAQIDALVAQKRQLIAKLKEKRQALIARTVTRGLPPEAAKAAGLEPNPQMKDSGVDWLGKIPEHWQLVSLFRVAQSIQTGPFGTQLHQADYVDDEVPLINPIHLVDGKLLPDSKNTVTPETAERLSRYKLTSGEIVFARRGDIGRCGVVLPEQEGWLCGTGSMVVRLHAHYCDSHYYTLVFQSSGFRSLLELNAVGTTMLNLNPSILGRMMVPVPPLLEQQSIVVFIGNETAKIDSLIQQVEFAIARLTEYRQALITSAVTGKIDVRNFAPTHIEET